MGWKTAYLAIAYISTTMPIKKTAGQKTSSFNTHIYKKNTIRM
ncbi:hypothetical protein GA0116948_10284 [Chitinophaga costaii]|uniref:Uncharacterized protein n=1 Tax=Chitinophaga costaii TaxID=1335309 RepID=A0A1C4AD42_9BACT|nr:hypothetical protein GA0116948_10284 [Chitinophaga costaii]